MEKEKTKTKRYVKRIRLLFSFMRVHKRGPVASIGKGPITNSNSS